MADISHLGNLNPVEQLDLDNTYPVTKESTFSLPAKGVYTLRAPDSFPTAAFGETKNHDLSVQIDPTIVAGPGGSSNGEGLVVRFVKISGKSFKRKVDGIEKNASQIGDYLAACGWRGKITNDNEAADAVESTAGVTYQAKLDWRAYNKRTGFSLEGMERFPKREDGTYSSIVVDPAEQGKLDDQGRQLVVFANLTIPFGGFIPAEGN
jgi:hypothetical protein